MHILDLVVYIVLGIFLWVTMSEENKHELGIIKGLYIMFIYTVIYLILFCVIDLNWIDLYHNFKINIKL